MTTTVNIPGVGSLNFPDGMSQADMAAAIKKNFPQIHNPANTKVPGYTASDTGQFTPIQNAGQPAQAPTGNAALGTAMGAVNSVIGGVNAIPRGLAGLASMAAPLAQGVSATGQDTADNRAEAAMNAAPQLPQMNSSNLNTQAANLATQQAAGKIMNAIPAGLDTAYSAIRNLPFVKNDPTMGASQDKGASSEAFGRAGLNITGNILPMIAGLKGKAGAATDLPATAFKQARDLGYKVAPSDAVLKGASAPMGKFIEGLSGSPKLQVDASIKNQGITNALAAQDIGVPKGTDLTPDVLDAAEQPHYKAYEAVKSIGQVPIDSKFKNTVASIGQESQDAFPMDSSPALDKLKQAYLQPDSFGANGAVLKIRQLRKDGNLNIASRDPEKMQLGYAQRQIAGAIEDQIDRYASSRPEGFDNPNLITNFRNARQALAKIQTVRDSITPGTTDVSAPYIAKQLNKGAPLSGNLLKIADTTNNFPSAMRNAGPLRNKVPVNALEGMMGGAGMIYGAATHNPGTMAKTAGLILGRPALRAGLLTDIYQNTMFPKPPMDPMLMRLLMGGAPAALSAKPVNQNPLLGNKQ